ncbi:delta-like protein C [Brachionichthys hirsutus]|uniref:delta-like protein C n=1 Tax=Brachionichthys hirsutus TaxID=412623 RepID=UPI0036043475
MARLFLSCLLLLGSAQTTFSSGVFELKINSFSSPHGVCTLDCHIFFRVCLKHSQDVINPEPPCTYGTALTEIFGGDSNSISGSAPIRVPFHFKWPGTFSLIIEAWNAESSGLDSTENQNNLISRLATRRRLPVGPDWAQDAHSGNQSALRYSYHVVCDAHYHGAACAAYCRPRNDTFGHFTCDQEGKRRCDDGWGGEYCSDAICVGGCSVDHGHCESPGKCVCFQGWQGTRCDECARHPYCVHGTCQQPWQCNCQEGWGGLYCDQDLNYCTNHRPCQNDASCTNTGRGSYTCACRPGFTGENCRIETNECESNPCRNGGSCKDLVSNYSCECPRGFHGKNCEIGDMKCEDRPCFHGGTCVEDAAGGYGCRCPTGFKGSNCEKKADRCSSTPCFNGAECLDLGKRVMCRCRPGFAGPYCKINKDDCAVNPCRNSGTCIDGVNDFSCTCTLGFTGKDCSVRASACDVFPCDNGGTCYTHFTGPVCQCPQGFMGARCEYAVTGTTRKLPGSSDASPALIAAIALGLATLSLLLCAAVHVLRKVCRGRALMALSALVKNDLETVNNRTAVIGGGGPNNGSFPAAPPPSSLREKETFLLPGGHLKVSNKDAAMVEQGDDSTAMFKNKMADCNLTKEGQRLAKNKFDPKKCDSSIVVPPLSFAKDSLYQPLFIIPDQMEQCVFATEVDKAAVDETIEVVFKKMDGWINVFEDNLFPSQTRVTPMFWYNLQLEVEELPTLEA